MTTYIAWDGNEYPLPTPDGWYLGADDRWWPEGHGPGPAPAPTSATGMPSAPPPMGVSSAGPPVGEPATPFPSSSSGEMSSADLFTEQGATPSGGGGGKRALLVVAAVVALGALAATAIVALGSGSDDEAAPATTVFQTQIGGDEDTDATDDTTENAAGEDSGETETTEATATTEVTIGGRGTIDDPFPIGEPIEVRYEDVDSGEERVWNIVVLEPLRNITEAVAEENQFNDPPPPGLQFMGAPIRVSYVSGPVPASLFELTFKAIGPSGVVLTTFDPSCGVIPDALDTFAELFEGGAVEGNVCWPAGDADQTDLTMIVEVFFDDTTVYADLTG